MRAGLRRRAPLAGLVLLLGFQLLSFERAVGLAALGSPEPVATDDYLYHYANALTVKSFLARGRWWGYDPSLYAGYPAGALLSIDNRALELLVAALPDRASATAQKLYLLIYWLSVPLIGWATARAYGSGRGIALASAAATLLFAECSVVASMVRGIGMIAFGWAVLLAPCVTALWFGLLARPTLSRLAAFAAAAQLLCLVHGVGPFLAAVPIVAATVLLWRRPELRELAVLAAALALLLAVNLSWALPSLHFRHHYAPGGHSSRMLQPGGPLMGLRILLLGANPWPLSHDYPLLRPTLLWLSVAGFALSWRSARRNAVLVPVLGALALLVLTYGASALPGVREMQPFRFLPASLAFLVVPAVWGAAELFERARRRSRWAALAVGTTVLAILAPTVGPALGRTVGVGAGRMRVGLPPQISALAGLIERHTADTARILVEDSGARSGHRFDGTHAQAMLPHLVPRHFLLGPHPYAPLVEARVTLKEGKIGNPVNRIEPVQLRRYFELYNIGWIVAWSAPAREAFESLSEVRKLGAEGPFVLYAVERPHSYFLAGRGSIEAGPDEIALHDLEPGSTVVLSYHYIDTLRTDSGHPVRRHTETPDPIGLIEIRDVPRNLRIRN